MKIYLFYSFLSTIVRKTYHQWRTLSYLPQELSY